MYCNVIVRVENNNYIAITVVHFDNALQWQCMTMTITLKYNVAIHCQYIVSIVKNNYNYMIASNVVSFSAHNIFDNWSILYYNYQYNCNNCNTLLTIPAVVQPGEVYTAQWYPSSYCLAVPQCVLATTYSTTLPAAVVLVNEEWWYCSCCGAPPAAALHPHCLQVSEERAEYIKMVVSSSYSV